MRQKDPVLTFLLLFVLRQTVENGSLIPLKNIKKEAKSKRNYLRSGLDFFALGKRTIKLNIKNF